MPLPQPQEHVPEEEIDAREEREALGRIVYAFQQYGREAELEVSRWEYNFSRLPLLHQKLIPQQPRKFQRARECLRINYLLIRTLLDAFDPSSSGSVPPHLANANEAGAEIAQNSYRCNPADVEKVRYVLKNLARDWSEDGRKEREQSYSPILKELQRLFESRSTQERRPRVLVPGAGLARLCCEIAGLGYEAQGNEFSYFMLLTSSFILNQTSQARQFVIHPWMHGTCNVVRDEDALRAVEIPDVCPSDIVKGPGLLSMCAGDFVEVYSDPDMEGAFDAVVTCFFIDTAHNVLDYLQIISRVLARGGYWINLGPLLYHWADGYTAPGRDLEMSVELSLEDIRNAAQQLGFKLLREETVEAGYLANQQSMYQTTYQASFWTMVKEQDGPPMPIFPPPPYHLPKPSSCTHEHAH